MVALIGITAAGCKKNSVRVKPNEIPPTETTTPAPPSAGSEPTPGKVPAPTSPTTPTPPNSDPKQTSQASPRVRVIYAATDAPAIDIAARGVPGAIVERLAPGTGTAYAALPATRINVRATASDSPRTTLLAPSDLAFAPGRHSTVVALTRNGALATLVLADDNTPAAAGKAKIRLVHAATNASAVRVLLNGGNAIHLDPGTATNAYAEVAAGDCRVAIQADERFGAPPNVFPLELRAGAVTTVVITDGPGDSALRLQVYTDR